MGGRKIGRKQPRWKRAQCANHRIMEPHGKSSGKRSLRDSDSDSNSVHFACGIPVLLEIVIVDKVLATQSLVPVRDRVRQTRKLL